MSYEISTPGNEPFTAVCHALRKTGLALNMVSPRPVITCEPAGLTVDEDTISTNVANFRYNNYIFLPGQVIFFQLNAAADIAQTAGLVKFDYQSEDGSVRDRAEEQVLIDPWRDARP